MMPIVQPFHRRDHRRSRVFVTDTVKIPDWIQSIVREKTGSLDHLPRFVVKKSLTATDRDRYQNRLLIPTLSAKRNLIPFLTDEEKILAGFVIPNNNMMMNNARIYKINRDPKDDGKTGIKINVFDKSGTQFSNLKLAYWNSSRGCVLKGKDYKHMRSAWNTNDQNMMVEVWCFRSPTTSVNVVPPNPENAEIDLELRLATVENQHDPPVMEPKEEQGDPSLNFIIGQCDDEI